MPLFACTNCDAIDNTALSGYWEQHLESLQSGKPFEPKCSECHYGKWHGAFPKSFAKIPDPRNPGFIARYYRRRKKNSTIPPSKISDIISHMALGLTFSDGKPAKMGRGKYQTRSSRIVEITGSHIESGRDASGKPFSKTIWDGKLFNADGRSVESTHTWSDTGGYLHTEGVSSQFDLMMVISQEPQGEPEPPASVDHAILENQLSYTELVGILDEQTPEEDKGINPAITLKRIIQQRDAAVLQLSEIKKIEQMPTGELETALAQRDAARLQVSKLLASKA